MDRHYDLAEDPQFWEVLDELEGDPDFIGELVGTLAQRAVDDPYRSEELADRVRVLRTLPLMRADVVYAIRLAYLVVEHEVPIDGYDGVVVLLHLRDCDPKEILAAAPITPRDRRH